ncbi:MAG TPA: ABC transporter permease [Acidobacteriaceae bacterium]|jgi:predicted permease|nr:ABC transporter permease [Acidobacteriaceae bacterium]
MNRRWFSFDRRKADLDAELEAHLRMAIADRVARGESEPAARAAAERELGNAALAKDVTRQAWGWLFLERLGQDFRYALRQIRRSPGFAATVIGTLALGIAAAAAMFTVVDHVLLQPVSYRDPSRLVLLSETDGKTGDSQAPWLDLQQWIDQSHSFQQIAFSEGLGGRNYLEGKTAFLEVNGEIVSSNLLDTLGVQPRLGRGFIPEKPSFAASKNAGLIVLSDAVWREGFGGDKNILGRTVKINNKLYSVAGVMPPGFRYPEKTSSSSPQVWIGHQLGDRDKDRTWNADRYSVIARLRPGVRPSAATAEMATIQKRVAAQYTDPDDRAQYGQILLERYTDTLVDADLRKALLALLAAAGTLWLIAAVNVTNLLLARSTARQREIAMRGALGASRWRVAQQMLVEGLVLSGVAGIAGAGLAFASVRLLSSEITRHLPLPAPATPDAWILLALLGLTVVSALMSTAWPALVAVRAPIEPALKQGGLQTGTGRRHHRMRGALVSIEVAMSLTLLVGCGLLLRTIYSLRHVPLGYRTDHIVVANLDIPSFRFAGRNMTQELYAPLLERAQHLPGVESAGLMSVVPLGATFTIHFQMQMNGYAIVAFLKAISPDVQRVFGFHMVAGRYFDAQDTATSQPVVVVNQAFARLYSPDKHNPNAILGSKLLNLRKNAPTHIVGILEDTHQAGVADPSMPEVEIAIPQITPDATFYPVLEGIAMDLAVRTGRPTSEFIPELRGVLRQASPELAGATITTMDQIVEDSYGSQRLAAHLLEIFGSSALLLCVAGLYGLLAYVVTQRTREMGVRIALGARRANLLWLVLRQAGLMLGIGVVAGSALALASGRLLRGFLYGVNAHDGWTLAFAAVLLFLSGMLAAYFPARRASRVNPMEALRAD